MSQFDDVYYDLCDKILTKGVEVENRTGVNAIKIPTYHFQLDPARSFPILTTKQVFVRQAIVELRWIYQEHSNVVRWLQERNVHIWDLWEIGEDGCWRDNETGEVLKEFDTSLAGTIGTAYGYIVEKYKLVDRLLDSLKNDVNDRRRVVSLWQDCELETAVLPSCVWSSEWDVTDGKLNLWVHQRSCDVPLGLPFNVTQYAILQAVVAKVCGLEVGTIDWSIKDAHIYVNQEAGIRQQQTRYLEGKSYDAPLLRFKKDIIDFYEWDENDIELLGYEHAGPLKFELTQ